jgi:VanZ family protein
MIFDGCPKTTGGKNIELTLRMTAPIAWAATILWLSLSSTPPGLPGILGWDKFLHTAAYALLAILIAQFCFYLFCSLSKTNYLSMAIAFGYGALIELLQSISDTGRNAEWWDLVADIIGAVLGCVIFCLAHKLSCQGHEKQGDKNG